MRSTTICRRNSETSKTVLALHEKVLSIKPDKWVGEKTKEKVVRRGIRSLLNDDKVVIEIFEIVKKQREYW